MDGQAADFAGQPVVAVHQLPVDNGAKADARPNGHKANRPQGHFGKGGKVHIVFQIGFGAKPRLDLIRKIIGELDVRAERDGARVGRNRPRYTNGDGANVLPICQGFDDFKCLL